MPLIAACIGRTEQDQAQASHRCQNPKEQRTTQRQNVLGVTETIQEFFKTPHLALAIQLDSHI